MTASKTIVALTGHEKPRAALLNRAELLAREHGATVILFDRDADLGPLMSSLPTAWSAEGEEEQFSDRLSPEDLEAAGQAGLAAQVRSLREAGLKAFGWLPSTATTESLAEYASKQGADTVLISAEDTDFVDSLESTPELASRVEVVPEG